MEKLQTKLEETQDPAEALEKVRSYRLFEGIINFSVYHPFNNLFRHTNCDITFMNEACALNSKVLFSSKNVSSNSLNTN